MADLVEMEFIKQPHTSAGRIPTDKGYRYYVDDLMRHENLTLKEQESILRWMEDSGRDVNSMLNEVSKMLGKISKELSVVLTPWISWGIFDRLEFIELTEKKVLVVIHVRSRLVKTVIIEVDADLDQKILELTARVLNERLSGLNLEEIQNTINDRFLDVGRGNRKLIRYIVENASSIFDFSEPLEVHTCGTQNILMQPEFTDVSMMERVLSLIDNREQLVHLFRKKVNKTEVVIGQENKDEKLLSFAVVTACYKRGKDIGALGVIGPTRMPYRRILPLVDFTAKAMSHYLS
jgi:heat-inducible transcriptional repressor